MELEWLIDKIQKSFQQELPGWNAQKKLSPGYDAAYRQPKFDAMQASVLVLISPVNGIPHLNFIKRASRYADDKHKGQIGFAGGKIEKGETELQAVIRESHHFMCLSVIFWSTLMSLTQMKN